MSDWWLTVDHGDRILCWHLGDVDDDQREDLITRARTVVDLPVDEGVHLHNGEPHRNLLGRCVIRDRAELAAAAPATVAGYRARVDQETRRARRAAARELLLQLPADERAELIAELPTRPPGGAPR